MARPVVHKTPEVKLQASRERHRCHYAKDNILQRRRVLRSSKTKESEAVKKLSKELLKAVAKALHHGDDDV
ncbi:hypothetical protein CY34DRAFT_17094 [Suillus luteus UH-Slu-Lm8-n1]|uniref:Uncharacterized protein n=1 Tax=Suillus luteus UH-Slu-Lm8-n1 TaxID=930992 RepID=A0A0D0AB47_9AGAM|nr:hypothetical protein CY34DRAFT_17094 [Suillus luteus UH-Slu-Lm8-n1]